MKNKVLIFSLVSCMFYLGCSGRTPNPVLYYMPGDSALNCEQLQIQMAEIKREVVLKGPKIKERDARNQWLTLSSPFEKDILKGEEIEIDALNARYSNLLMLALQNGCVMKGVYPALLGESGDGAFPLLCSYCGPRISKGWRLKNRQLLCNECYKKEYAHK